MISWAARFQHLPFHINNDKKLLEIQNNKTRALKASVFLWREIQKEKVVLIGGLMVVFAVAAL